MKITCKTKELKQGIQTVSRAVAVKSAWPVLSCILVEPAENRLRLTGSDLELGIQCTVPAKFDGDEAFLLPGKLSQDILSSVDGEEVELTIGKKNQISLQCGKASFNLNSQPSNEYRALPDVSDDRSFEVSQSALRDAIKQTVIAVSDDDTRLVFTGVLLALEDHTVTLASTDTHRLAVNKLSVSKASGEISCIIPKRALVEVSRLLASDDEPVTISIADSQIKFVANGTTIASRLIDGEFPNYQRIIPANSTIEWTVGTDDLTAALRRIELISRDDAFRVTLSSHGDILTLAAKGDTGTASEELDVIAEGEDVEILFNARYLLDFMSSVSAEAISVKLSGSMAPGLFQPKSDDDIIYVVMCMQRIERVW